MTLIYSILCIFRTENILFKVLNVRKRIPSKTSHYPSLIEQNGYYVDKTHFLSQMEEMSDRFLFFLRPRRFGKSLHLSVMEHYYGIQYKGSFDSLFGNTWIGKHPTSLRNSYHTLSFNFSGIETSDAASIKDSFISKVISGISGFYSSYPAIERVSQELYELEEFPSGVVTRFFSSLKLNGFNGKIFLFIDEYDHFTNELFSFREEHFKEVVSRNGWVRKFYEIVKQYMGEGLIDRFFATGVTPVTLDSMTSGFNVAKNISLDPEYNTMAGFTEDELLGLIQYTIDPKENLDKDRLLADMRDWYNGSKFSVRADEKVYNPQLVASFLVEFGKEHRYPDVMADHNVTSDYKKIFSILDRLQREDASGVLHTILEEKEIVSGLTLQFNPELQYSRTDAVSMLFYNGLLTLESSQLDLIKYVIPNYVIHQIYWDALRKRYETEYSMSMDIGDTGRIIIEMALEGKIDKLIAYMKLVLSKISNRDLQNFRESNLKMMFLTLLTNTNMYMVTSEMEVASGYTDIYLRKTKLNPGKFQFLFELKYLKSGDEDSFLRAEEDGKAQITRYISSLSIDEKDGLLAFLIIFRGKQDVVALPVIN